jgi:hypothetical protein
VAEQCYFCEREADSQEHAWPDWLVKHVTERQTDWQLEVVRLGSSLITVEQVNREIEVVVECVCDRCNRGWMKKLEDRVSVFARWMMDGNPTVLTGQQGSQLARWAAKTALTLECSYGSAQPTPRHIREQVRMRAEVPISFDISLGAYDGVRPLGSQRVLWDALDSDELYLVRSVLFFGNVLVETRINTRRKERAELLRPRSDYLIALTGVERGDIQWPPRLAFGDDFIDNYAAISNEIVRRDTLS